MRITLEKLLLSLFLLGIGFLDLGSFPVFAGNPPDATQSTLLASPPSIPANGLTQSTITVTLKDSSGTPLVGDLVQIQAPSDVQAIITPGSVILNSNGQGTFTYASTQAGTDSINVIDMTTSTTLTGLGQIQLTSTGGPTDGSGGSSNNSNGVPICNNPYPPQAPNLYAIFKNSNHTSDTLYFVPPPMPYDGFSVSYGLSTSADTYAVSFSQGQSTGAIKYSVNSLIKDAPYYFKVRATNGCARGPWSNVKSASSAVTSLPKTGPNDFLIEMGLIGILSVLAGSVALFAF